MHLTRYHLTEIIEDNHQKKRSVLLLNTINSIQIGVDETSFTHIKNGDFHQISDQLLSLLKKYEFLTELNDQEEIQKIISENITANLSSQRLNIVIQPTAWCQLGCLYCGQSHTKDKKINIQSVLQFIEKKIFEHQPKELLISWFGAEPLTELKAIQELSSHLKKLCLSKDMLFVSKMVTNGLNLTENNFKILVEECNCKSFEITLDGTSAFHDKRRFTKYKGKTFDVIYKNLIDIFKSEDFITKSSVQISIRCNVDDENREGVIPLIHKLHQDGLHKKIAYFYVAPVHSWGNEAHLRLKSIEEFAEWEFSILVELLKLGFKTSLFPDRKKQLCLATSKMGYLIDPQGDVFGCTEISLVPSYEVDGKNSHKIGSIHAKETTSIQNTNPFNNFFDEVSDGNFNCRECQLLPLCGGRCPKEWFEGRPACPSLKFNIHERLILNFMYSKGYLK